MLNKRPRLSKSGVEYLDYSWGVWSGCRNLETGICQVKACWAKGLTSHYPRLYPNGFDPTYYPEAIDSPKQLRTPSRISVGWVGDVIGYCDPQSIAKENIFKTIEQCPQHTFLFLTKNPEKLFTWGSFPDNCWVGVSATNYYTFIKACYQLEKIEAKVKYISFEPLFSLVGSEVRSWLYTVGIKWVIIGACTGNITDLQNMAFEHKGTSLVRQAPKWTLQPKIEWVQEIVEAADKAKIPVFLKENLRTLIQGTPLNKHHGLWAEGFKLRQEMPSPK